MSIEELRDFVKKKIDLLIKDEDKKWIFIKLKYFLFIYFSIFWK